MTTSSQPPRLAVGVFGVGLLNTSVVNAFPFLAGALIDAGGVSTAEVGLLISLELIVTAVTALALSAPRLRLSPRIVGLTGCAAFALGNLLAAESQGPALAIARMVAGLGGGLGLAAAGRAIALASSPARLSAAAAIVLSVIGGAVALCAGALVAGGGYANACLLLAALAVAAAPFVLVLPGSPPTQAGPEPGRSPIAWRKASPLLCATALTFLASGSIWSYCERIGLAAGLSHRDVTTAVGLSALAGAAGGWAAMAFSGNGRRFLSAGAGVLLFGASACALALASAPLAYVTALTTLSFGFVFVLPFLLACAVDIDPSGGLASATYGAQILAGAVAPFVGGLTLLHGSFETLGLLAALASALALGGLVLAARAGEPST